jgi:hypothetical protein
MSVASVVDLGLHTLAAVLVFLMARVTVLVMSTKIMTVSVITSMIVWARLMIAECVTGLVQYTNVDVLTFQKALAIAPETH